MTLRENIEADVLVLISITRITPPTCFFGQSVMTRLRGGPRAGAIDANHEIPTRDKPAAKSFKMSRTFEPRVSFSFVTRPTGRFTTRPLSICRLPLIWFFVQ